MSWKNTQLAQSHKNKMSTSRLCFLFFFLFFSISIYFKVIYPSLASEPSMWLSGSHNHTYSLLFFLFAISPQWKTFVFGLFGFIWLITSETQLQSNNRLNQLFIYEDPELMVFVCVLWFQGDLSPSEHERRSVLYQQQRAHHHHWVCKWQLFVPCSLL